MQSPRVFDALKKQALEEKAALKFMGSAFSPPDFLLRHGAQEILSRLSLIKRRFSRAADLSARHGVMAEMLKARQPDLHIVSLSACLAMAKAAPVPAVAFNEEALPLKEGSLDLITSVLALHLVNDVPGVLFQARKALKPDGLFIAALLGGDSLIELRQSFLEADAETGRKIVAPRVFPTLDMRDAGGLLQRAGFALPVADSERLTVTYASPLALMMELKAMGAGNILAGRARGFMRRDTLARAVEIYQNRFSVGMKRIAATFEIFYMSGWAPHESQQQPLRPGSATRSLAKALNTAEIPAGDKANFPPRNFPPRDI